MPSADVTPVNNFETNAGRARPGRNPPRPEMAKRVMDVEEVLSWAYRDELPKTDGLGGGTGEASHVSPMFRMGVFGSRIDNWNREPGFPSAMGPPHPDALLVAGAVGDVVAAIAEGGARICCLDSEIDLGADLRSLGADEVAAVRGALGSLDGIVARCAKLRQRPYWTRDTVPYPMRSDNGRPIVVRWEPRFTRDLNGQEVEHQALVQAEARRKDDYPFGSHCPLAYAPDPQTIAGERAEWLVWWGALSAIAEALSGKLASIAILPPSAPQRPWLGEEDLGKPPRVFEDLSARTYQREQRETAAAHRALGLRGSLGARGAARGRGLPTRVVRTPARPARAACNAG